MRCGAAHSKYCRKREHQCGEDVVYLKTETKPFTQNARLAEIDGDDGYTGFKPQHRYVTCPPWHRRLDFFYSNKNNFVLLEDTTIKTERCCSMQCTERTRAVHHSSLDLHCFVCPDQISCASGLISRIQRGNGR